MAMNRFLACARLLLTVAWLVAIAPSALAQSIALDPPESGFVLDRAALLSDSDVQHINDISRSLMDQQQTPIVVVTIESMADHWGYGDIRIETFAHLLFDQWQIGTPEIAGETWNTGMLLLVSKGDRKARIQLGAGWGLEKDNECLRIMNEQIIPHFKRADFARGIVSGVEGLDQIARGRSLPVHATSSGSNMPGSPHGIGPTRSSKFNWLLPLGCGVVFIIIVVIGIAITKASTRSDHRSKFLSPDESNEASQPGIFGRSNNNGFLTGLLMGNLMSGNRRRSSSRRPSSSSSSSGFFGGGGFSAGGGGGGFRGGGFSGGGGASGSW